ncbi:ABC transporter ATP-binding protein [Streptomyces sp. Y7]|uniref:ABC transporter ATP-binding protein n=1 Tax=Streptomyces sp. Y7 TaxID=3342392 RepID=UPI0037119ECD
MTAGMLDVSGLTVRFGGLTALDDVTFEARTGELLAIIGPNGAGKSSLFNALTGVYPATGSATVEGAELIGCTPPAIARRGVARTFQNLGLFDSLDVMSNLLIGRHTRMRGGVLSGALWLGRARREDRVAREELGGLLDSLDLARYRHQVVGTLPYGVRKQVDLARALAAEPRLLLLDEPVAGLNTAESERLVEQLVRLRRERDMTILLVEHDMPLVMSVADRVAVLDFGRLVTVGTPDQVQKDERVVAAYLGERREADAAPAASVPASKEI